MGNSIADKVTKWQKEIRMKIAYKVIGNFFPHVLSKPYFDYLRDKIPGEFFGKNISDIGCGDGFSTQKIKDLFKAKSIKGYEVNDFLIAKAKKRGLTVEKLNLEKDVPRGDMAVVWGVLHHLKNKEEVVEKIKSNFNLAVFNEPVKSFWAFLDGGEPLTLDQWKKIFNKNLGIYRSFRFRDNYFVFWKK